MTAKELNTLKRIPKRYREHITNLSISKSGDYNERGQELINYTVTWDNGEEHTYQKMDYMVWHIKEYYVEGFDKYICD